MISNQTDSLIFALVCIHIPTYNSLLNPIQLGFAAFSAVMLSAGGAGQGRHQWNVTIAGLQRIALVGNFFR